MMKYDEICLYVAADLYNHVPVFWWFQHVSAKDIPSDVPEKLRARRVFQGAKAGREACESTG